MPIMSAKNVLLDTDIGDDLDDAFCLALMLRCPELRLKTVTTVFNDTRGRAATVEKMCDACDVRPRLVAGFGGTMSIKPLAWATSRQPLYRAGPSPRRCEGPEHLIAALAEARRDFDAVFAIGPMTNLAASLLAEPDVTRMPRVLAMAGEFSQFGFCEYNIRNDVEAAARVFAAGFAIDLIPWKIGVMTKLDEAKRGIIRNASTPLGRVLADYMRQFHEHEPHRADMFDPMAVIAYLKPELFEWQRGFVSVETRGDTTYGMTMFRHDAAGPHRWASDVNAARAVDFMLDRICS
jgi:purine nucleosidase